jgi:hypothetical protein
VPENVVRDWLALLATSLSALFAGLIWWMARKKWSVRYEFSLDSNISPDVHAFKIEIANRTDATIVIESISVNAPVSILVSEIGDQYGATANR